MKALVIDCSRVLIFANASSVDSLNQHHKMLAQGPGYQLLDHFTLNHELISYLGHLSAKVPIYIFTTGALHELPEVKVHLGNTFTDSFSATAIGSKKLPGTYTKIAESLGLAPAEIAFVDDQPENVQAAATAGLTAQLYESNEGTINNLIELFGAVKDLVTLVDDQDNIIGYKHRRSITYDDIYRISSLWLTNTKGQILLAQRSFTKDKGPGLWGPAAAGTIEAGESYEANMYKEAEEEIGLTGVTFTPGPKTFLDTGRLRRFSQWYLATVDRDIEHFVLQVEEVEQAKWVEAAELVHDVTLHPKRYTPSSKQVWSELMNGNSRDRA